MTPFDQESPATPAKSEMDAPHVRTREEVEQMVADHESEMRRARLIERLGDAASTETKPDA